MPCFCSPRLQTRGFALSVIPFTKNVLGEPNEVSNLSGFEDQEKGFLGTQRASE